MCHLSSLSSFSSAWYDAQREGGRFQGVAVGSRATRAALAQTKGKLIIYNSSQGKQIIADKTGE